MTEVNTHAKFTIRLHLTEFIFKLEALKTKVASALEQCTSIKKMPPTESNNIIELLATALCLMLSESAGMAKDLCKLLPAGLPQKGAQTIACSRLENADKKAKRQFEKFITAFIEDADERKKVLAAFNADVDSIAEG